jgi:hypothetical protein
VIHAGVLLYGRAMPARSQLKPSDQRELHVIDIELPTPTMEVRETPPDNVDPTRPAEPGRAPDVRVAARAAVLPSTPGAPGGPPQAEAPPETNPAPASTQKPTQFDELPGERPGVLGVPGVAGLNSPVWSMPGVIPHGAAPAPAPTVAPAPRPVDPDIAGQVVREAMAEHDKGLGLDLPAAGSMTSAVQAAIQVSEIPVGTKGSIQCSISPNGAVSGCNLLHSTGGGNEAWDRAKRAAQAIVGAALPGQYARGATVIIDITVLQAPPAGGKGGFSGTGMNFDVSNIGGHATRQVRASHRVVAAR